MKKTFAFLLAVVMTMATFLPFMAVSVSAEEVGDYHYTFGDVEIVFDADTKLTADQREAIAVRLAEGSSDDGAVAYNLWCSLFGHKTEVETVERITHCVYASNPRCVWQMIEISVCSRCDEVSEQVISTAVIECCP